MGALLALASALSYGLSDVIGGVVARRMRAVHVALLGQLGGLVAVAIAAPLLTPARPDIPDLAWGGLSGLGTGLAMAFLFRGMSRGAMSVVVPISAVGGIALPVLVGVALLGDRPAWLTWTGVGLALPGLWLVSRHASTATTDPTRGSVGDGLVAGAGIALQYLALARCSPDAGLWPVLAGRLTAVLIVGVLAVTMMRQTSADPDGHKRTRSVLAAAGSGVLAAVALTAYALAAQSEFVTVAVVLSSLYPVVPALVGIAFLGERLSRRQVLGLAVALTGAVLIAVF
ncbi:multidrug transporter [Pseudonocardia sulfidoxydans NBRC 16205]|uniref:Multidrug transporter n=1 Tax=Pseudonocardia sulfidoxydans NBRC 16205 TaxID=1223511 RepID=A0A511DH13_9PSEU|nr:GRP family sugar transporter [Pseudonocardia sulfidoxydans]GEL24071.1 multidrug transporter [Pseudonocardia sulfidoxydans NBRC 16205]